MGPTGCPEMPVRNYHYLLLNKPEEWSSPVNHTSKLRFFRTGPDQGFWMVLGAGLPIGFLLHMSFAPATLQALCFSLWTKLLTGDCTRWTLSMGPMAWCSTNCTTNYWDMSVWIWNTEQYLTSSAQARFICILLFILMLLLNNTVIMCLSCYMRICNPTCFKCLP